MVKDGTGFRDPDCRDYWKAAAILAAFVVVLIVSCILLTVSLGMVGFIVWIAAAVPLLLWAMLIWHSRSTAFRCPACGHEFIIGAWKDLLTPHILDKFRLKCPRCGKVGWMRVLVREGK